MALGERNFPTLKTNLENHMYTDSWQKGAVKKYGTEIYIDYNPEKKTLQLLSVRLNMLNGYILLLKVIEEQSLI